MKPFLAAAVLVCLAVSSVSAQVCAPNEVLMKNDTLPAVPPATPIGVSVIPGLCEGEAIGSVFDVSGIGQVVKVNKVAGPLFNSVGANGAIALVNLKIYDGITWTGTIPTLGTLLIDWAASTQTNIQFTSHAINELDISQQNITVTSGKLVVVWEMDFNINGDCATGYPTNFGTDFGGIFGGCTAVPQANLIRILGQGWRDPANATVSGFALCPIFYNGNWVIRACVEDVTPQIPVNVSFLPTNSYTPSGLPHLVQFTFDLAMDPSLPGQFYLPAVSATLGNQMFQGNDLGIFLDFVTNLYLNDPTVKTYFNLTPPAANYFGVVPPTGFATGIVTIPAQFAPPFTIPLHFICLTLQGGTVTWVSPVATLNITP